MAVPIATVLRVLDVLVSHYSSDGVTGAPIPLSEDPLEACRMRCTTAVGDAPEEAGEWTSVSVREMDGGTVHARRFVALRAVGPPRYTPAHALLQAVMDHTGAVCIMLLPFVPPSVACMKDPDLSPHGHKHGGPPPGSGSSAVHGVRVGASGASCACLENPYCAAVLEAGVRVLAVANPASLQPVFYRYDPRIAHLGLSWKDAASTLFPVPAAMGKQLAALMETGKTESLAMSVQFLSALVLHVRAYMALYASGLYRDAAMWYSLAIDAVKTFSTHADSVAELPPTLWTNYSVLLSNRAQCFLNLRCFGLAYADASEAFALDSASIKSFMRLSTAALALGDDSLRSAILRDVLPVAGFEVPASGDASAPQSDRNAASFHQVVEALRIRSSESEYPAEPLLASLRLRVSKESFSASSFSGVLLTPSVLHRVSVSDQRGLVAVTRIPRGHIIAVEHAAVIVRPVDYHAATAGAHTRSQASVLVASVQHEGHLRLADRKSQTVHDASRTAAARNLEPFEVVANRRARELHEKVHGTALEMEVKKRILQLVRARDFEALKTELLHSLGKGEAASNVSENVMKLWIPHDDFCRMVEETALCMEDGRLCKPVLAAFVAISVSLLLAASCSRMVIARTPVSQSPSVLPSTAALQQIQLRLAPQNCSDYSVATVSALASVCSISVQASVALPITHSSDDYPSSSSYALFMTLSAARHACAPNARLICFGDTAVLVAESDIAEGSPISIGRIPVHGLHEDWARRQADHVYLFGTFCDCELCISQCALDSISLRTASVSAPVGLQ
eukprot:ANDGO_07969.mRNA.1 hypothetical protein